jgi:wyosine [tRNA(Phe)-imidazoG37] synthetase (radical SAM superfamily)
MYAYGPVPSRRLGNSIGVSPIPAKVCSYSCVYCQLGRTRQLQAKRQRFFPKEDIFRDIKKVVESSTADVITFAGDGEPTLCGDLGWLIRTAKQEFGLPVATITNGSLLFHEEVQRDLQAADIILPTLDAGDQETFYRINRPHGTITYEMMINGLTDFRKGFSGQIWLEVMLVKNLNDSDRQLFNIRDAVRAIAPDKIFIMTPIRPPAEDWVECPEPERIRVAEEMLSEAITVLDREEGDFGVSEFADAAEAILEIAARHPLRLEQARAIERKFGETGVIEQLLEDQNISINRYRQSDYIRLEKAKNTPGSASGFSPNISVDQVKCGVYRVTLDSEGQKKRYRVILADGYYNSLARGRLSKEELLETCFRYFLNNALLERLGLKFSLRDVGGQFPQFETDIRNTIVADER